ncbi:hypothetical protein [Williamsia sp. CHRR-6]|uniref:hypothetical protein n=1 Tax=Williamsia sp. CHRR-6 TaxID=2835871 RepID=UPI001BDB546E|nr:hypothetical protein [Williamsia sp. CHRR-6]MBT0565844.1 hypothetical protein [Williamsia sp. CHRR-6]
MHHVQPALAVELEALATLSRADIDRVIADPRVWQELAEFCLDEEIDHLESADDAEYAGDGDLARHHTQEAAAWRHTARVLRQASVYVTPSLRSRRRAG